MTRELSVVVPTYNEGENIKILIPRILQVFKDHDIDGEIVIVEDQSTDGSRAILESMQTTIPCLRVIFRQPPNSLAGAWREGFTAASKDIVVCIDADLCHDPKYFPEMLKLMDDHDIVIGSRYLNKRLGMMEDKSILAVYMSIFGQFLTRFASGLKEYDTSHSFRMFRKSVFTAIAPKLTHQGNVFLIEFLMLATRAGARVIEYPIEYGRRIHGTTKLRVYKEGVRYLAFIGRLILVRGRMAG